MRFLFVHQGFPGQYLHICRALSQEGGHTIVALAMRKPSRPLPKGVELIIYTPKRGNGNDVHTLALETETKVIRAEACAEAAERLTQGFTLTSLRTSGLGRNTIFAQYMAEYTYPDVPGIFLQGTGV